VTEVQAVMLVGLLAAGASGYVLLCWYVDSLDDWLDEEEEVER
jgi:hypothetical protein